MGTHLVEGHSGDDGQHNLVGLGGVGVGDVGLEPGFQHRGGLAGGVLPSRASCHSDARHSRRHHTSSASPAASTVQHGYAQSKMRSVVSNTRLEIDAG